MNTNSKKAQRYTIRLQNLWFSLLLSIISSSFLIALSAQEDEWGGQRVVNVLQEPRHRIVHKDGDLYVLDVQINPGDTTLPHTHDSAILYTFISNSDGPLGGIVDGNTDYAKEEYTHQVSNEGTHLFRIIALANYGPGEKDLTIKRPQGLSGEPQLENEWFRSYRIELAPGEETAIQLHKYPSIIIQATDGVTHITRNDGITNELDAMGDFAWRKSDSPYIVRNAGKGPVVVVINEGRR